MKFGFDIPMSDFMEKLIEIEVVNHSGLHKVVMCKSVIDMQTIWSEDG